MGWLIRDGLRTQTGYKNCKRCTHWRPISDYRFGRRYEHSSGLVTIYVKPWCYHCEARDKRERHPNRTPEQVERQRTTAREWASTRRRMVGMPVRKVGPHNQGNYGAGRVKSRSAAVGSVDPAPVLRECERAGWNRTQIAQAAGVDPRSVYRWYEEGERMELDAADRLCLSLGIHLSLVFGCE